MMKIKTFNRLVCRNENQKADFEVSLSIDERRMSRIITKADCGEEIAICIDRGQILEDGQFLMNDDGQCLMVVSALEDVTTVKARSLYELVRLAYHLGNRHVPLEVNKDNYLRYQSDHVLDDMVIKLGGFIVHEKAKFSPENGAYSHHHEHSHD